jgi:hypothetical protein
MMCFLCACLCKESFFLMGPALAWLRWQLPHAQHVDAARHFRLRFPAVVWGYAFSTLLAGVTIAAIATTSAPNSHGGISLHVNSQQALAVLLGPGGILRGLLSNSLWCLPLAAVLVIDLLRLRKIASLDKSIVWFTILAVVPQILLYMTRRDFSPRYCFPALVGLVFVNVVAIRCLLRAMPVSIIRLGILLLVSAWIIRCLLVQFFEGRNLAQYTQAVRRTVQDVVANLPDDGTVIIVASPKTEHAICVVHQLGMLGRPHARVYLYQPNGSDGHAHFCFRGRTNPSILDSARVDAVVYLIPRSTVDLSGQAWYHRERFTQRVSPITRSFISLRERGLVQFHEEIEYDVASGRQDYLPIGPPL